MNSEVKTLQSKETISHPSLWDTLKKHYELVFAVASGIFILVGWLFTKNDVMNVGITYYILAYIVGGYAKAKEGIEDTIEEKELNVEMLMLFAAIGAAIVATFLWGSAFPFIKLSYVELGI
ncbi:heavy metal translocating P-type ATPase, partial [Bacillus thuringiensis]|nr:heavy metal translocating P-type ATPase [Bacillus thuringiensis]